MKPTDLPLIRQLGRPAIGTGGHIVVSVKEADLAKDSYRSVLHRFGPNGHQADFTVGPRDSAPVISPDGRTVVFLRGAEKGGAQLFVMPIDGGEPRQLTDHPLGVGAVVFSPDGSRLAYLAAVAEPGRYGTDKSVEADAEPPRRIVRMDYRQNGKGFVLDRPEQVFVLDLTVKGDDPGPKGDDPAPKGDDPGPEGADPVPKIDRVALKTEPRQITAEPSSVADPVFTAGGTSIIYARQAEPESLHDELAIIDLDAGDGPTVGRAVHRATGSIRHPVIHGNQVLYLGVAFEGYDAPGRTTGLWSVPLSGGSARRLTDDETVEVGEAGPPTVVGDIVIVSVSDRGSESLRSVPLNGRDLPLNKLPALIGGRREVKSFAVVGERLAAVVATPQTPGELLTLDISPQGSVDSETAVTDLAADLRQAGVLPIQQIEGTSRDGYPVQGWLVLPAGPGPHPVLLDVHGGPHAAYTWSFFDEAQVYAAAGYAVVLPNPRGSAGYGQEHGRAIVGRLGSVDADDVLAVLDAALEHQDCDAGRVGVMGGSYGGFMTSWLASHTADRFAAAISERAVNAWDSFAGSSDIGYFFAQGYVGNDPEESRARSPLTYADDISIPLLIIHSEQDWRCPVEQAQRLFVALKSRQDRGAETEMLLFPAEDHELSRSGRPAHRLQRFQAILDWWDRYLPVSGPSE